MPEPDYIIVERVSQDTASPQPCESEQEVVGRKIIGQLKTLASVLQGGTAELEAKFDKDRSMFMRSEVRRITEDGDEVEESNQSADPNAKVLEGTMAGLGSEDTKDMCSTVQGNTGPTLAQTHEAIDELLEFDAFNSKRSRDHWVSNAEQMAATLNLEVAEAKRSKEADPAFATFSRLAKDSEFPFQVQAQVATRISAADGREVTAEIVFAGSAADGLALESAASFVRRPDLYRSTKEGTAIQEWLKTNGQECGGGITVLVPGDGYWKPYNFSINSNDREELYGYTLGELPSATEGDAESEAASEGK